MWNPVDPETVENPLPFWAWLRKQAPVWEVPDAGYFTVSRCEPGLRDILVRASGHRPT